MTQFNGKELSRIDAIRILDGATCQDDPFWENIVQDWYDEESDTIPSIFDVLSAIGVSREEYFSATRIDVKNWPTNKIK